jgi:hypothetical protein
MNLHSLALRFWLAGALAATAAVQAQSFEFPQTAAVDTTTASAPASLPASAAAASGSQTAPAADGINDKRIYGVLPNYRMADGTKPFAPITTRQKLMIGVKDSFDYPAYVLGAVFAGLNQMADTNPEFGQGVRGYAKRYGTSYADQAIGNLMSESLFPAAFHHDPRYFRIGKSGGSGLARTGYALSRILICYDDKGHSVFNISELGGNAASVAISNLYYTTTRTPTDNAIKWGTAIGTDAVSNILKEFWPDVKEKFLKKKN